MTSTGEARLTLGQLCRQVGLARASVLYYESLGLLIPLARSAAGYRLYGEAQLERLRTIRRLREAGLTLADIGARLGGEGAPAPRRRDDPVALLERRLLGLCDEVERLRDRQRLLARLLALPDFRTRPQRHDKAAWVALLRRAGFDDAAMNRWHVAFEHDDPEGHAAFLRSIGLSGDAVDALRRASRTNDALPAAPAAPDAPGAVGIRGISHLTFLVRDLDRTARLLTEGLGAREVYDSAGRNFSLSREKFFLLGGTWLAFMEGAPTERSYRHVAFEVPAGELPAFERRLAALGVEIRPPRPRVQGEGQSLYFHDYDNHLFELHAGTLEQRLSRYSDGS